MHGTQVKGNGSDLFLPKSTFPVSTKAILVVIKLILVMVFVVVAKVFKISYYILHY